jgi:hypothetical protein
MHGHVRRRLCDQPVSESKHFTEGISNYIVLNAVNIFEVGYLTMMSLTRLYSVDYSMINKRAAVGGIRTGRGNRSPSFLPLGATAQGELWPPEQSASILLYSSSTI